MSIKVQVVFYSMYGHVYGLAEAVAAGAREVAGVEARLLQVPELVPDEALVKSGAKAARAAFAHIPIARPEQLAAANAILFGTPTRFGNMCAQMRNFLDQTTSLWLKGALIGKGNNHHQFSQHPAASRHDHRRRALCGSAPHEHEGNHRRYSVWGLNAGRRRWVAAADGERTGHCPLSGQARRRHCRETVWMSRARPRRPLSAMAMAR